MPERSLITNALALTASAVVAVALAGCGGKSQEEKAKDTVCNARADIQKRVESLRGLTLATASADQVKSDLNGIKDDLGKIADAQDKLDSTRKAQVQKAQDTFKSQMSKLSGDLTSSQSLQGAAQQLRTDLAGLASAYQQAFAPIDCS